MLRRILSGLAVFAISLLFGLLALEVGLRVMGIGSDTLMRPHPWTGWAPIPGRVADVTSEDSTLGRRMSIRIDALGLRDIERDEAKPAGTYRVLVLGDSYVEAVQVPLDSTLTRRMERALDGTRGHRVEIWNCGVSGYNPAQELLYLRHIAANWRPDLVVLCFLSGNDLADAVPENATSLRNRPFYRLSGDSLVLDRGQFRNDPPGVGWLRTRSRAFTWASTLRQAARIHQQQRGASVAAGTSVPADFQIYALEPDSSWARAWNITERLIVATRDEARSLGSGFLLVSISNGVQEHPRSREHWTGWPAWSNSPEVSLDEPERRLGALASRSGIDYLPLLGAFRDEQARNERPLHIGWTGHWNSSGHAVAARVVGARIEAAIAAADSAGSGVRGR